MSFANPNVNELQNVADRVDGERQFGGQMFEIFVTLDNHSSKPYPLPNAHILEMVIEENLMDWPYRGYIIYSNKNEGIERNINNDAWFYRMDARDEINIKVKVVDPKNKVNFPREVWEMDLDFIVYDMEDILVPNITNKMKKIYFWDKRYQMMMDKKLYWSTATAQKLKNAAYLTDMERAMLTGDAIEKLLTDAAGYENSIDKENWDRGSNKIFYTSPMHNSIVDDLNELLSGHLSETKDDMAIFKYSNRVDKQWQLVPIHKLFDAAGKSADAPGNLQIEHLFFENIENDSVGDTSPYRAPYKEDLSYTVDIKSAEYNKIATYEYVDMAGVDNTNTLVSKPVYSYSLKNGNFLMDYEANEIESVRNDFKTLYTNNVLGDGEAFPMFTLNQTKTNQINTQPEFTFSKVSYADTKQNRLVLGKGKILYAGLMLNAFIKFRLLGSTHRTVGKFVGIDRKTTDVKYKFDNKICGQWLVTNVKHIWNHNRYVNDVCAVKVHMYNDNGVKEDIE